VRRFYSRLGNIEEKKNKRKALFYVLLCLVSLILLIFFGLPSIVKMAAFLSDLRKSTSSVEKNDVTPPAPPKLDGLPEATNKNSIDVQGSTEEGATVKIFSNDSEEDVIADKDGRFKLNINLKKGENKIAAIAKDLAGNESQKSSEEIIIFDEESPKLDISSPENREFFGSKQRQVIIKGITEEGSTITVNDRFVFVEDDGTFAYATTLTEGDNNFNIKAVDQAGNSTETSLILKFSS